MHCARERSTPVQKRIALKRPVGIPSIIVDDESVPDIEEPDKKESQETTKKVTFEQKEYKPLEYSIPFSISTELNKIAEEQEINDFEWTQNTSDFPMDRQSTEFIANTIMAEVSETGLVDIC